VRCFLLLFCIIIFSGCVRDGSGRPESQAQDAGGSSGMDKLSADREGNRPQTIPVVLEASKLKPITAIGELEKKALLGDKSASMRLARSMTDDMEQWTRIAIENGNEELAAQYATFLLGKEPYNCYRAMHFAEVALKHSTEATKKIDRIPLDYLTRLYDETSFKCGCPQELPGYRFVCKAGQGMFEKDNP
jgi:hypothetical protein